MACNFKVSVFPQKIEIFLSVKANNLEPDQVRRFIGTDLGPNCLPKVSADDTGRQIRQIAAIKQSTSMFYVMNCVIRKPAYIIICKTKTHISCAVTVQLISAFDNKIPLLPNPKFQASNHLMTVADQPGLCRTWLENLNADFLLMRQLLFCLFLLLHRARS